MSAVAETQQAQTVRDGLLGFECSLKDQVVAAATNDMNNLHRPGCIEPVKYLRHSILLVLILGLPLKYSAKCRCSAITVCNVLWHVGNTKMLRSHAMSP
jgi:hypothetical protein